MGGKLLLCLAAALVTLGLWLAVPAFHKDLVYVIGALCIAALPLDADHEERAIYLLDGEVDIAASPGWAPRTSCRARTT